MPPELLDAPPSLVVASSVRTSPKSSKRTNLDTYRSNVDDSVTGEQTRHVQRCLSSNRKTNDLGDSTTSPHPILDEHQLPVWHPSDDEQTWNRQAARNAFFLAATPGPIEKLVKEQNGSGYVGKADCSAGEKEILNPTSVASGKNLASLPLLKTWKAEESQMSDEDEMGVIPLEDEGIEVEDAREVFSNKDSRSNHSTNALTVTHPADNSRQGPVGGGLLGLSARSAPQWKSAAPLVQPKIVSPVRFFDKGQDITSVAPVQPKKEETSTSARPSVPLLGWLFGKKKDAAEKKDTAEERFLEGEKSSFSESSIKKQSRGPQEGDFSQPENLSPPAPAMLLAYYGEQEEEDEHVKPDVDSASDFGFVEHTSSEDDLDGHGELQKSMQRLSQSFEENDLAKKLWAEGEQEAAPVLPRIVSGTTEEEGSATDRGNARAGNLKVRLRQKPSDTETQKTEVPVASRKPQEPVDWFSMRDQSPEGVNRRRSLFFAQTVVPESDAQTDRLSASSRRASRGSPQLVRADPEGPGGLVEVQKTVGTPAEQPSANSAEGQENGADKKQPQNVQPQSDGISAPSPSSGGLHDELWKLQAELGDVNDRLLSLTGEKYITDAPYDRAVPRFFTGGGHEVAAQSGSFVTEVADVSKPPVRFDQPRAGQLCLALPRVEADLSILNRELLNDFYSYAAENPLSDQPKEALAQRVSRRASRGEHPTVKLDAEDPQAEARMQELGQLMRSSFNECGPTNVLLGKQIENIDQLSELRAEMWRDATQEFVPDRELFQEWREESLRSSRRLEEQRLRLFQLDLERQKQFESQLQAGPAGKVVPGFNVTPEAAATPKSDGVGTPISAGEGRKASDIVVAPPPADVDVTSATVEIVDTATAEADLRAIGKEQALLFFQEQSHLCSSTAPASDDNSTAVEGGPSRHNSRIAFYVEPPLFAGTTPREDGEFSWASQSDGSQYFANSGPYQGQAQRPVAADERKLQQLVSQGRVPITHDPSCVFVETKLKNTRHHATHPQGPRPQVRSTADSPSNKSPAPAWWWDTSTDNGGLPLANLDTLIASPWQLGSAPTVTLEESAKYKTGARNSGLDVVLPPFEYALDELSATAICSGKEVRSEPPQTQKTMKELLTDELDSMLPPTASESQFDASPALGIPSSSRGHSLGAASDAQQTGADEENPEHPLQASPAEKEAERTNGVRVRKSQEMEKILVAEKASMTEFNQDLIANLLPPTGEVLASANLSNSGNPKPMNSSRRIEAIDETAQRIGTVHDLNESHLALLLPHLSPAEVGNALLHPAASPQRSSLKEKSLTEQPSRQEKDAPPPEHLHTLEHFHSQVASLDRTLPPMDYDLRDSPAAQNRETNTDVHSRHPDIASVHKHIIDSHADHRVFDSKQEEAAPQPLVSAAQPLLPAVPQVAAVDASEQKRNTESLSALESEFTSMKQAQTKLREEMEQSMRSEVEEMRAQLRAQMQQEREAQQKTAELQELERRKQNEVAQTARAEQEEVQKQLQAEMAEKMKAEVEAMKKSLQQEIEQKVLPVQALAVEAAEKLQAVSATAAEQAGAPARPENQDPEPARPTSYALLKSLRDEQDELQKSLRTEVSAKMQAEVEALKKALQEEIEQKILPVQSIAEAAAKTQAQQVLESQQAARNDAADFAAVQERQQEQQRLLREEMAAVLRTKVEEMKTSLQEEMAQKILPVQSLAEEAARRSSKPEQGEQHPADQNPVASAEALQAIKDELRTELQEQITSTNVVSPPAAPSASTEAQLQALKDELRTELHEQIRHVSSSPHHHVENQHNGATNGTGPLTEELQEKLRHELQASIETELHQARATLKRQMEEELEAERKAVEHEMELKRERLKTEFDQEKETLLKTLERERKVLHTEVDQEKRLLTVEFEKQQKLLDQSLQQERDRLHEQFATERRSIEESLGKEKAVLERGVEKEREALQKQFEKEHQELQLQLQKQQQRLDETLHEDREKLTQELVEKQKAMELSLQKAEREVEQERKQIAQQMKDESEAMQREFHQLAKEIHATRDHTAQELATEFGEHRAALQKELAREQEKLQKDLRRDQEHLQAELHEEQVHLREELQAQERSLQEEFRAEERKAQQLLETKIHEGQSALGLKARKMEEELAEEISRTREDIHRANREEEDRLEDERAQLREQMRLQREQIQQRLEEERMEVAHELEQDKREWRERRLKQHEEELREKMTENISAQLQQDLARHLGARDRRLQHNSELLPAGGGVTSFALHDSEGELIGSRATLIDDLHPHLGARHSKSRRSHSRGGSALEEEQALDMLLESTMRHRHRRRERERSAIADGDVLQLTQKTDHLLRSRDGIAAREHAGAHRHTRASKSPKTSQHLHSGKYSRLGPDFDHDQYLNHNDYSNLNDELISSKASSHRRELLDFLCVANGTTTRGASLAGPNKYLAGTSLAHLNVRPQLRDLIQAPAPHLGGRHPGRHVGEGEAMLKDEDVPERPVQIEIEDRTRSHVEQDEHAQSQKVLLQTVDALIPDEGSGRSGAKAGGPLRKPGPPESDESDFANHPNWLEGSSEDDRAPVVSAQIRTPPTSLPVVSLLPKAAASAGLSQPAGQHTDFESDMSERPPVTTSEDDDLAVGTTIQYFAENSRMWIPGRVMAKTSSLKGSHLYSVRVFHGAGNHKEEVNIENLPRDRLRRKKPYAGVVANSYSAHDPKKNNHGHPQHNGQGQHGEHLDVEQEDSKKPRQEGEAGPYDVGHLDDERF